MWGVEKIDAKTGIKERCIAAEDECASDLAFAAANRLFDSGACAAEDIDFLLFCTQSPDYALPTTACLLQERLSLPVTAGALDYNLGCSGFIYGLGLAQGLIATGQAHNLLLLTAETFSKYLGYSDRSTRTLFGDGAAATLVTAHAHSSPYIGPFVYGTDGRGKKDLIAINTGFRRTPVSDKYGDGNESGTSHNGVLFMNGRNVFDFAISTVPYNVNAVLVKANLTLADIDLFVFHQANAYLIEEIRKLLGIPSDKIQLTIEHCANTGSSTIPIALKHAAIERRIAKGSRILICGFGVGYSWGAAIVRWGHFLDT